MKIEIKNRISDEILFAHDCENNSIAATVAVMPGNTNLSSANLSHADLSCANLSGADLSCANLFGANLFGANFFGANFNGAGKLVGARPYFTVGPIGSRNAILTAFLTENGIFLHTGCFFGTMEEFKDKLQTTHGISLHGIEYRAALAMIEAHYSAWPD